MRDSYNDFCYRQRENCEGRARGDCRLCVRAHRLHAVPPMKRQSNQYDAMHAGMSLDAGGADDRSRTSSASRRLRYRYAQNFVGTP
ncbi:TPA: hypothetical protein SAY52_003646 [Burkholderia cenocepacia]|uniref:hypothetical protein n=1 Tax=unclassified Burkholderia TaxID=2613784 RepID=UPI00158DABD0|nr:MULTISPECIES: hypothetical protein [unclassified Burkholderia]HEF5873005.1 hypothetical protein [Burkholderia cenocepacia]